MSTGLVAEEGNPASMEEATRGRKLTLCLIMPPIDVMKLL